MLKRAPVRSPMPTFTFFFSYAYKLSRLSGVTLSGSRRKVTNQFTFKCSDTKIQTKDVVATAAIVPVGIAFDASARSPDRLEPAIIPDNKQPYTDQQSLNSSLTKDKSSATAETKSW